MTGERIARLSLRIDAIYCMVLGITIAGTAPLTATSVAVPLAVLVVVGVAVFAWGGYVGWASRQQPIRTSTRFVMIANIAASLALAATGAVSGATTLALASIVLAIDVAAFAVSQGVALRRMRSDLIDGRPLHRRRISLK